jgi:hypothetical protein
MDEDDEGWVYLPDTLRRDVQEKANEIMRMETDRLVTETLCGAASTCTSTTGAASALTMADILEAKRRIEAMPPPPPIPDLIMIPWPIKQTRVHRKRRINKKWAKKYGKTFDGSADKGQVYLFRNFFTGKPTCAAFPRTFDRAKHLIYGITGSLWTR